MTALHQALLHLVLHTLHRYQLRRVRLQLALYLGGQALDLDLIVHACALKGKPDDSLYLLTTIWLRLSVAFLDLHGVVWCD